MKKKLFLLYWIILCSLPANIKSCLLDIFPAPKYEVDCAYLLSLTRTGSVTCDDFSILVEYTKNDNEPLEESETEKYRAYVKQLITFDQCSLELNEKMEEARRHWKNSPVESHFVFTCGSGPDDYLKVKGRDYYEMFLDGNKVYVVDYAKCWAKQKMFGGSDKVMTCVYDLSKKLSRQKIVSIDKDQSLDTGQNENSVKKASSKKLIAAVGITGISLGIVIIYLCQKYGYWLSNAQV